MPPVTIADTAIAHSRGAGRSAAEGGAGQDHEEEDAAAPPGRSISRNRPATADNMPRIATVAPSSCRDGLEHHRPDDQRAHQRGDEGRRRCALTRSVDDGNQNG